MWVVYRFQNYLDLHITTRLCWWLQLTYIALFDAPINPTECVSEVHTWHSCVKMMMLAVRLIFVNIYSDTRFC